MCVCIIGSDTRVYTIQYTTMYICVGTRQCSFICCAQRTRRRHTRTIQYNNNAIPEYYMHAQLPVRKGEEIKKKRKSTVYKRALIRSCNRYLHFYILYTHSTTHCGGTVEKKKTRAARRLYTASIMNNKNVQVIIYN